MKLSTWIIGIIVFLMSPFPVIAEKEESQSSPLPSLNSQTAVLIDATTGRVLYDKASSQRMYPASITKMATAIIAIEQGQLDDLVTVSENARYVEGTRVFLGVGEQKPMLDLLYGLMMNSGNDAAVAIAEHMDGSTEQFAERMNEFIKVKIGLNDTNFTNPHGLYNRDHYSTAYDMARIAQYAMRSDLFRQIVSTKTLPWLGREWESELVNHNKLLWRYEGATGIKNGYVDQSGFTLVASAKRGSMELIAVGMGAESSEKIYADMTKLLDYGFAEYETVELIPAGTPMALPTNGTVQTFVAEEGIYYTFRTGETREYRIGTDGQVQVALLDSDGKPLEEVAVGQLSLVTPPTVTTLAAPVAEESSNMMQWVVFGLWAVQLAFIGLVLFLKWRKKRRYRNYYSNPRRMY